MINETTIWFRLTLIGLMPNLLLKVRRIVIVRRLLLIPIEPLVLALAALRALLRLVALLLLALGVLLLLATALRLLALLALAILGNRLQLFLRLYDTPVVEHLPIEQALFDFGQFERQARSDLVQLHGGFVVLQVAA